MEEELISEDSSEISGLNPKQQRFCDEYLLDLNGTAAARRAGYTDKGAANTACRLLELPEVKQYIARKQKLIVEKLNRAIGIMAEELSDLAVLKRRDFYDAEGDLKNIQELPDHLLVGVNTQTRRIKRDGKITTVTTYSLFDKIQMMERITKGLLNGDKKSNDSVNNTEPNTAHLGDGVVQEF